MCVCFVVVVVDVVVVFCLFFKNPFFCRENEIFENKKQKSGPVLTYNKAKLDQFLTLQHIYIHTYIHAVAVRILAIICEKMSKNLIPTAEPSKN